MRAGIKTWTSLSLFALLFVVSYGKRALTLSMPAPDFAPWSRHIPSTISYLEILKESVPILMLSIDESGQYIKYEIIVCLALHVSYLALTLY